MSMTYGNDPATAYNLMQFLNAGKNTTLKYPKFCFQNKFTPGLVLPVYNVLDDYIEEIDEYLQEVNLKDDEVMKYKYNPKKLAYDVYGSTELFVFILYFNKYASIKDFTLNASKLKLLNKENMSKVLSYILSSETSDIELYNSKNT